MMITVLAYDEDGELRGQLRTDETYPITAADAAFFADEWRRLGFSVTVVEEQPQAANDDDDSPWIECPHGGCRRCDDYGAHPKRELDRGRKVYDASGRCIGRMMPASNARQEPKSFAMRLMLDRIYAEE